MNKGLFLIGGIGLIGLLLSRKTYAYSISTVPIDSPSNDYFQDYASEFVPSPLAVQDYQDYQDTQQLPYQNIQDQTIYGAPSPMDNMTRGERNNNPGNIVKSANQWQGKIAGNDSRFETFDTPQNGIRALTKLLKNYIRQGNNTLRKIINKFAPPVENDTSAYLQSVSNLTGIPIDAPLTDTPEIIGPLVNAIISHENGRNIYLASGIMEQGIMLA